MFFSWVTPLIEFTKRHKKLKVGLLGELRDQDKVEIQIKRLRDIWDAKKNEEGGPSKNALVWAVLLSFKSEYTYLMCLNAIQATLSLSSPFIIKPLIEFVKTGENAWEPSVSFFDTSEISWLEWFTPAN